MNEHKLIAELKDYIEMYDERSSMGKIFRDSSKAIQRLMRIIHSHREIETKLQLQCDDNERQIKALNAHNTILSKNVMKHKEALKEAKVKK